MASFAEAGVYVERLSERSTDTGVVNVGAVNAVTVQRRTWIDDFKDALAGKFPEDLVQARRLKLRIARFYFCPSENCLFRRGFSSPSQRCLSPDQTEAVMTELHGGRCGDHSGGRTLTARILRLGYYWPTMEEDAVAFVKKCDRCQRYADNIHTHPAELRSTEASWPFARWGIDLVGPFPVATSGLRFLVVAVDYFTKWVEAKPLVGITSADIIKFVWKDIVCRFGVPHTIVADNGPQFSSTEFVGYMERLGTRVHFASVSNPQSNGQVEAVNKTLVRCIEKRLTETTKGKKNWPEALPAVLWSQRTKPNEATGDTPFSLAFGSEAVLPVELTCLTARIMAYDEQLNEDARRLDLDLIEKRRDAAALRNACYRQKMARHYNAKVKTRVFQVGDLVLKRTLQNMKIRGQGKLGAPWMGPYTIARVGYGGAYDLIDPKGKRLERPWNGSQLKKFYALNVRIVSY